MQPEDWNLSVHPSSGVPVYRQIVDQIAAIIAGGRAAPGDMLPSVRSLAASLAINMMTVSKAYSRLELEGVLERVRGKGMIVAPRAAASVPVKRRQAELRPLLEQAVVRGRQLDLAPDQITAVFESVLQEFDHARSRE